VALSVLLSLCITLAVRRALLREVRGIGESAHDLASGNLTVRARDYGRDEISDTSRTLDASIRTLNGTLKEILDSARSIDSASRQIALGNTQLSECAGRRATSFEPTRATMEQLSATVSQNALNATAARRLVAGILGLPGEQLDMHAALRQVSDILSQIGDASAEQASGISDVSCAIVQMDHITQENTTLVEAAAAAAARLQAQAASLSQAVAAFKLDEGAAPVDAGKPRLWLASRRE
jgi:methyl-accepting chemotaxis protein